MSKYYQHTVQQGDSLSKIAAKYYGDINQWPLIANANNISNPDLIFPGQVLELPGVEVDKSGKGFVIDILFILLLAGAGYFVYKKIKEKKKKKSPPKK